MSKYVFATSKVLLLSFFCTFYIVGCTNEVIAPASSETSNFSKPVKKLESAAVVQSDKGLSSKTITENTINSYPSGPTVNILNVSPVGGNVYAVPFIIAVNQFVDPVVDVERTVEILNSNFQVVSTLDSRYVGTYASGQYSVYTPALTTGIYRLIFTTSGGGYDSEIIVVP